MTFLLVKRGPQAGQRFNLLEFPITIGRDNANTIPLIDQKVSRFHIRLKKRGRLHILEDLDSKNGCYINGDRVVNSIVQNGDLILIGESELMFVTPSDTVGFAAEVLNFEMVIDKDLGINGPIDITDGKKDQPPANPTPYPFNYASILNKLADNVRGIKRIYDIHGNIIVIDNLEEAASALLKGISQLAPGVARGVVLAWSASQHQLIPMASKQFGLIARPFHINQRALSEVLALKQGMLLPNDPRDESQAGRRHRMILPMLHNEQPICLVHLESDHIDRKFPLRQIELIQTLLTRAAPSFESMLLRKEVDALMLGMVETVVATIEAKDTYTVGHSERVCRFSMAIADELKLNKDIKKLLMISSLCHDIGKIGIPDAILKKASLLSSEEYGEMKLHPTIGANIIAHMPNAQRFISGVKYHHEKWDGTGYPEGLAGENIPFFGRIVAVADVFDAMISGRSYSGFIDESDAIEKINSESELFDPEIVKALIRAYEKGAITQRTSTFSRRSSEHEKKLLEPNDE